MADSEKNAVIYFGERDRIELRSTVEQIQNQLEGVTNPTIPTIEVQAPDGESIYVNANHVRAFAEYHTAGKDLRWHCPTTGGFWPTLGAGRS